MNTSHLESSSYIESPFYLENHNEINTFKAAYHEQLPLMLKGPTGCGKTRFVEYMAAQLQRPLITVPCHEDITAADLVGRYLLEGGNTAWVDGPLTRAVREGAICYLDEVVEARSDTTVVIHPLADHRRELHIERLGESLQAPKEFMLVLSYNPGYQSVLKDLKPSTRQRMIGIEMNYPEFEHEVKIVISESNIAPTLASDFVKLSNAIRKIDISGLPEVSSTRTLISAARLTKQGLSPREAAQAAICVPLTDDLEAIAGLNEIIQTYLSE